ncbi:MAG: hypothetical protein HGB04_00940 [Chlorobiaceae bacterium]|nr:hypothetical protein [Chlorobiaceae bacterium]
MFKEAAGAAGAAIMFSPFCFPFVAHGIAGLIVGNAGLFVASSLIREIGSAVEKVNGEIAEGRQKPESEPERK